MSKRREMLLNTRAREKRNIEGEATEICRSVRHLRTKRRAAYEIRKEETHGSSESAVTRFVQENWHKSARSPLRSIGGKRKK